jgi:hypothetical protein
MKNTLAKRWTLFPVIRVKEVPCEIAEILDDLRARRVITSYKIVDMYGGRHIEVWYTNGYIEPDEQNEYEFWEPAAVERLEKRCEIEHTIVERLEQLGLARSVTFSLTKQLGLARRTFV